MTTAHLYIQTVIDNIDFIGKKISCSVGVQGYTPKGVCTLLYPKNRHFALFRGTGTKRGTVPFCTPNYCIYSQCIFAHHHDAGIHLIGNDPAMLMRLDELSGEQVSNWPTRLRWFGVKLCAGLLHPKILHQILN